MEQLAPAGAGRHDDRHQLVGHERPVEHGVVAGGGPHPHGVPGALDAVPRGVAGQEAVDDPRRRRIGRVHGMEAQVRPHRRKAAEHLAPGDRPPAVDPVGAVVDACPGLTLVATSREPLGLPAEHLVRLGPLTVPEHGARSADGVPAVEAFLAHARRRQPDLAVAGDDTALVAEIVRRLDGLPLALELAAGRVGTLSLGDLHTRLDRALDLFETGRSEADARHRTLRDTIAWSHGRSRTTRRGCSARSRCSRVVSTWRPPSGWPAAWAWPATRPRSSPGWWTCPS